MKAINVVVVMFMFRVHVFKVSNSAVSYKPPKAQRPQACMFCFLNGGNFYNKVNTSFRFCLIHMQMNVQEDIGQTPLSTSYDLH